MPPYYPALHVLILPTNLQGIGFGPNRSRSHYHGRAWVCAALNLVTSIIVYSSCSCTSALPWCAHRLDQDRLRTTATPQATRLQPSCAPSTRHQHPPTSACAAYALRCCCNCTPPKDVARASEIQALCHRTTVLHYPSILYTYYTILEYTCMHLNRSLLFSVTPLSLSVTPL